MSTVGEIERAIEELPLEQRWQVLEHTRRLLEAEIPESFRKAMGEIGRGEVMELDDALKALEQDANGVHFPPAALSGSN